MTVGLYIRVSTEEQAKHGHSIGDQVERLQAYCVSQRWDDYKTYIDDGYTGTHLDRPQLKRLLRHIEQGKVTRVVVTKLDRLSRRQKDVLHLIEDIFQPRGVAFVSSSESFDTETPYGRVIIGILSAFAQFERDTIVERTRQGRKSRLRKGLWPGGNPPYGYKWDKDSQILITVPHEADHVRSVYHQFINGKSMIRIAQWLSRRTTRRTVNHTFVRDMVTRPTYAALVRNGDELTEARHDPIVDRQTWDLAQLKLEERTNGRRPYGKYLLSNIGICGACGATLKHQTSSRITKHGGRWTYYMCTARHKGGKEACPESAYYNALQIEHKVAEKIKQIEINLGEFQSTILPNEDNEGDKVNLLRDIKQQLASVNNQLENITNAIASGITITQNLRERSSSLESERETLENRIDELEAESELSPTPDEMIDLITNLGNSWDDLTYEEQSQLLRDAVKSVIVYPDKTVEFEWNRP